MGWFCNNIIEYLLLGKDFLWSKAINLLNMSLKDSPSTWMAKAVTSICDILRYVRI